MALYFYYERVSIERPWWFDFDEQREQAAEPIKTPETSYCSSDQCQKFRAEYSAKET